MQKVNLKQITRDSLRNFSDEGLRAILNRPRGHLPFTLHAALQELNARGIFVPQELITKLPPLSSEDLAEKPLYIPD